MSRSYTLSTVAPFRRSQCAGEISHT